MFIVVTLTLFVLIQVGFNEVWFTNSSSYIFIDRIEAGNFNIRFGCFWNGIGAFSAWNTLLLWSTIDHNVRKSDADIFRLQLDWSNSKVQEDVHNSGNCFSTLKIVVGKFDFSHKSFNSVSWNTFARLFEII